MRINLMKQLPDDIICYIIKYLPILSPCKKKIHYIINHYNNYFLKEMCKCMTISQINLLLFDYIYSNKYLLSYCNGCHKIVEKNFQNNNSINCIIHEFTLKEIQYFYHYIISYREREKIII